MCIKIKIERTYKSCDCGRQHEWEVRKKCSLPDSHVGPCLFNLVIGGTKSPHNDNINNILTIMFIFYKVSNIDKVRIISNSTMSENTNAIQLFMKNWLKEVVESIKMKEVSGSRYQIRVVDVKLSSTYIILFKPTNKFYSKVWNYQHGLNLKSLDNEITLNHNMKNLYIRRSFTNLKQIDDDDLSYDEYMSDDEPSVKASGEFLNVCSGSNNSEQTIISDIVLDYIRKLHPLRYLHDFRLNIDITRPWVYINYTKQL